MSQSTPDHIRDDGQMGKYFHQMLNMADDDLDPYEYRLLGHYVRVCGRGGSCWEAIETTAHVCKMSVGMASKTRRRLAELGWISLTPGRNNSLTVRLIDRMSDNVQRYKPSPGESKPSSHEGKPSPHESKPSPGEAKNNSSKKTSSKKNSSKNLLQARDEDEDNSSLPPEEKLCRFFAANIGRRTAAIDLKIADAIAEHGEDTVQAVMDACVEHGARTWRYVATALANPHAASVQSGQMSGSGIAGSLDLFISE